VTRQKEDDSCRFELTENGIDIEGSCASQFVQLFAELSALSREIGLEISGYACIDPKTGEINRAAIYDIGSPNEVTVPRGRTCPCEEPQITFHSHPISGLALFSEQDGRTIVGRVNRREDDGHCVVGQDQAFCILSAFLDFDRVQRS